MQQFFTNYTELSFLEKIRESLRSCRAFHFSVSFIKKAGLVLLLRDIEAALERGATGRLITSTYQNFTDIESLRSFLGLMARYPGFSCHLDFDSFHDKGYSSLGYHSKGYLFEYEDSTELLIGSSNLTRYALTRNIEWDLLVAGPADTPVYKAALAEFEEKWEQTQLLTSELIALYSAKLNFAIERWDMDYDVSQAAIKPNYMQRKALKELNRYRALGLSRALIIAAAGSGKTFLAAFDALNFSPKRLLYLVHEGSILKKSLETFQQVFGGDTDYGIYDAQHKELDASFLFSTNLTMSRNLELFPRDHFDYIVVDECHHATAETYRKIMDYFTPEFYLGLTATPERMDNEDVFGLFDGNVPFELRLREAILNDLVVPFHYYGIRDQLVDYSLEGREERRLIAQMVDGEHCDFLVRQIEAHRPRTGKLKALAFCRSISHARMLAETLGESYNTAYLTGRNDIGERIRAYNDLQNEAAPLEILFTVDILNEGVDIPGVNMVLFLRPTESSTIFIQQLGRGLRKYENKTHVTVLDFIGNSYKRSVQIAFALSSLSENFVLEKRLMAALVQDDFSALGLADYGVEIHIDDLSKEEILHYIDSENFNRLSYLRKDYENFKAYLRAEPWPTHLDYLSNDCAPDLLRFLQAKIGGRKNVCYYNFLRGIGEENLPPFTDAQIDVLSKLSAYLPLVRPEEYLILRRLLEGSATREELLKAVSPVSASIGPRTVDHALGFLPVLRREGEAYSLDVDLTTELREHLEDLAEYGLTRYAQDFPDEVDFKLWHTYRMDQVQLRLLNNPGYTAVGTYYQEDFVIIFASLKKDLPEEAKLNYKDKFLAPDLFQWESRTNLPASDLGKLRSSRFAHLFIRKVYEENGFVLPFTYVGRGRLTNPRETKNGHGTWLFDVHMENELPDYLRYDFGIAD